MEWIKLSVAIQEDAAEIVSEILLNAGALGTEIAGGSMPIADDPDTLPPDEEGETPCSVCAYFALDGFAEEKIAEVKAALLSVKNTDLGFFPGTLAVRTETVKEEDWANAWKQYFKPQRVSNYVVIKPTWEEYEAADEDVVVEIDPGMAFGTGTHESTRMCIIQLEKYVEPGISVLDIGCGSGILSVTAAKLGAAHVTAADIDSVALEATEQNAAQNKVAGQVHVLRSNLTDSLPAESVFHIVVANIVADVILQLAPVISQYIKKPGIFICSGIIRDRLEEVRTALEKQQRLRVIEVDTMGEWCAITCKHK